MNNCPNCQRQFELEADAEQLCPHCGEPLDAIMTLDADQDFATSSQDDTFELEIAGGEEKTFESTQEPDVDEGDLLLPKTPVTYGESVDEFDSDPQAPTELPTAEVTENATLEGEPGGSEDDDFELTENANTEPGTEVYQPDHRQPTVEAGDPSHSAKTLEYAPRLIAGLTTIEPADPDEADYIIAMQDEQNQLGSGASGVVYRAKQKSLDRVVAIKLLKKQVEADTQSGSRRSSPKQKDIDKFLYESQITARLDHPNVITVHDLGVTDNDTLFYSMKLFEGGRDWSKDFDNNSLEQNLDIFNDVCDAMRRAHRDRIVHRDLKPQNVLVADFGEVQVTDWGLAISLERDKDESFSGGGTPCYMAPEMASHFLAQQDGKTLKAKLKWTLENAPDNTDEMSLIKQRITEQSEQEKKFRELISESSDIYVMGAILFQIASGYPPHLFQISDLHRRQWGSQTGRNKVRRELEMAANRTIARYTVRGQDNPEAREALRDIAMRAMEADPADRYEDVAGLQRAVREFRNFMRCIEDTRRGDQEVAKSAKDPKSYVQLNNAIYAYQGALEDYPDYEPARDGLANAKFQFAERALRNQDFELGLATMDEDAIAQHGEPELAGRLRDELVTQRNRRDRRKRMLFIATMASLVSIGMGILFAGVAWYSYDFAKQMAQRAENKKAEAEVAIGQLADAKSEQLRSTEELVSSLTDLQSAKQESIELEIDRRIADARLKEAESKTEIAEIEAKISGLERTEQEQRAKFELERAQLVEQLADAQIQLARLNRFEAQIDSERIKESTQFDQYVNQLTRIQDNIDKEFAQGELNRILTSRDISLPVKNAWELHHLVKRANPATEPILDPDLGQFRLLDVSADGSAIVAVADESSLVRFDPESEQWLPIAADEFEGSEIVSIDLANDGRWLVVAVNSAIDGTSEAAASLPLILDLESDAVLRLGESVAEQLRFEAVIPDSGGKTCKEKFFCNAQHVEFLHTDDRQIQLLMVDQRTQQGLNQLRCSLIDIGLSAAAPEVNVEKIKIPGQLFLRNPGLLNSAASLASTVRSADGSIYVALINSHPRYAATVIAFGEAVEAQQQALRSESPRAESKYFSQLRSKRFFLDRLQSDFAPTAVLLSESAPDQLELLIGNGKGEIARIELTSAGSRELALRAETARLLDPAADMRIFTDSQIVAGSKAQFEIGQRLDQRFYSSTESLVDTQSEPDQREAIHRTAVRAFRSVGNRIYSISESEIFCWHREGPAIVARDRLFGHEGSMAALGVSADGKFDELYTVSNVPGNANELRKWQPDGYQHDATIVLDQFRQNSNRKIVAGAADKLPGSEAVVLGLDDGSIEYFSPTLGRVEFGKPADADLDDGHDAISRSDFRNGRFGWFGARRQLVMYSNSVGLLWWDLDDPNQTDYRRSVQAAEIYRGVESNSAVHFSADAAGENIVTSHPRSRDKLVLWQLRDNGDWVAAEIGPFRKTGGLTDSGLNVSVQPVISPDGRAIAVVLRLRNSWQIQIIETSPSRNPRKIAVFDSEPRTNFRFAKFLADAQLVVAEDRIEQGTERETSMLLLEASGDRWTDQTLPIPKSIRAGFRALSISDVVARDGNLHVAGFGIRRTGSEDDDEAEKQAECRTSSNTRSLIAWDESGLLYQQRLPFSRRISPRFAGDRLIYMAERYRSEPARLEVVGLSNFDGANQSYVLSKPDSADSASRWHHLADGKLIYAGDDWLALADRADDGLDRLFEFSLSNPAKKLELSGDSIVVRHSDQSTSLIHRGTDPAEPPLVRRLRGFHRQGSLSLSGQWLAIVPRDKPTTELHRVEDLLQQKKPANPLRFDVKSLAITWVRGSALRNLGVDTDAAELLVTATAENENLKISIWDPESGKGVAIDPSFLTLPLEMERNEAIESFEFASVTGSLAAIVWDTKESDRADIWKYSLTRKPGTNEDPSTVPRQWFLVDDSAVGQIEAVHFSEVVDPRIPASQTASRIVIGANNLGNRSFKLYALQLGANLRPKQLLDLFVAEQLQQVDQIRGASFSGDGKSLLTMTSEVVQLRLTDGWNRKRNDAAFERQIIGFQQQIESTDSDELNRQIETLTRQQQMLQPGGDLDALQQDRKSLERQLADASRILNRQKEVVQSKEQEIRANLMRAKQAELTDLARQISQSQSQIDALKADLEGSKSDTDQ